MRINIKIDERLKKILIVLLIILAGVFVFQECTKEEQVENAITNVEIKEKEVDEVLLSMVPVSTLNPLVSTDEDIFYISKLIYSSLFTFDETMTPAGDLAEKYTYDGDTIVINLKRAKWHDGNYVDANDVEFTIDAIKSIGKKSPYFEKADKISEVSGDGSRVKIRFKDDEDMSLSYLSFPIMPEHKYDGVYDFKNDIKDFKPVGSGIYKYSSYDKSKALKLSINENYYGEKARSSLKINIIKKSSNRTKMTEASNITALLDKDATRETKITKKGIKIENFIGNKVDFIGFNMNSPFMSDKDLRKMVCYATNISDILEEDYYNSAVKSDSLYIPGYLETEKKGAPYKYNMDKVKEILKDKKFKDTNDDSIIENQDGKAFKMIMVVEEGREERIQVAERIKKSLDDFEISLEVKVLEKGAYTKALKAGNFDMYIGGMTVDEAMDFRNILSSDGENNYIGYKDEKIDKYLTDFMSGQTLEENKETLTSLKKRLNEEIPYYTIGYQTFGIVKSPVFRGELQPSYTNPYKGIETWYCEYEERIIKEDEQKQPEAK